MCAEGYGPVIGGVETGGTKIVCALGTAPDRIVARTEVPTTERPALDLDRVASFFADAGAGERLSGLGIASFGPCGVNRDSPTWGRVTTTPKPGWAGTDVVGTLRTALTVRGLGDVPIAFDTDVNAAAIGEHRFGAGAGLSSIAYVTVGTGIGAGIISEDRIVHGLVHPEAGHVLVPRGRTEVDGFVSVCPFHRSCLEGLACGPAMAARWGVPAQELPPEHSGWQLEASYLGAGLHQLVCVVSPQRVIIGGGVGMAPGLLPLVRAALVASLDGYVDAEVITSGARDYVVPAALGADAGVTGALVLAESVAA